MDATLFQLSATGYGLACLAALLTGLGLSLPGTLKQGLGWGGFVRFAVAVTLCTLVCARLMFVLPHLLMGVLSQADIIKEHNSVYLDAIGSAVPALYFWDGGYALAGAIPGAILGAKLSEKWTGAPKGFFRDLLAVALPAAILIERLAEIGTDLGIGMETDSPLLNGMGFAEHPLWLYEALLALAVLVPMLVLREMNRGTDGDLLRLFLVVFCLPLIAIEALRPLTGHMVIHFVNLTQVTAMVLVLCVLIRWSIRLKRNRQRPRGLVAGLLIGGWIGVVLCLGVAVYCIFGMEKDWVTRGTAYLLITLTMAAIGAYALTLRHFADPEGGHPRGAQ